MPTPTRTRSLSWWLECGAAALAASGVAPSEKIRVVVEDVASGGSLCYEGRPPPPKAEEVAAVPQPAARPEFAPSHWRWFSPAEEAVIRACQKDDAWHTAEALAVLAGSSFSTEFRALLRNLVSRGVLASATSRGYRLNRDGAPGEVAGGPA